MNSDLAKTIFEVCLLQGSFRLRSGQISDEYFDKYQFESEPAILEMVVDRMTPLVSKETELLAGLEMGGIPVATGLSLRTRLPVVFVRKKAKEYGTCKFAEGISFAGKNVLVIEDVVTTGGAIIDGAVAMRQQGARITNVLSVIDREQGGRENLAQHGLELTSLFTASELRLAAELVDEKPR
jgi:orotate phosphoribosyltransferase